MSYQEDPKFMSLEERMLREESTDCEEENNRLRELVTRYAAFVEADTAANMGLKPHRVSDEYATSYVHGRLCRAREIARDALDPEHPQ